MNYLHINADSTNGQDAPVVMKVSKKAWGLCGRLGKLAKQHRKLERELLTELAEINNMSEDEVSDIMCVHDFLVDAAEYGVGVETSKEIDRQEYYRLRGIAKQVGSMEVLDED